MCIRYKQTNFWYSCSQHGVISIACMRCHKETLPLKKTARKLAIIPIRNFLDADAVWRLYFTAATVAIGLSYRQQHNQKSARTQTDLIFFSLLFVSFFVNWSVDMSAPEMN